MMMIYFCSSKHFPIIIFQHHWYFETTTALLPMCGGSPVLTRHDWVSRTGQGWSPFPSSLLLHAVILSSNELVHK